VGSQHARLHQRRPAGRVDLEDLVHRAEVEADGAGVPIPDARLDPTDHRRASAVRDDRDPGFGAPVEDLDDLGLGGRADDQVGDGVDPTQQRAYDVAERSAETVREPVLRGLGRQRSEGRRRADPAARHREGLDRRRRVRHELGVGEQRRDSSDQSAELVPGHRILDVAPRPPRAGPADHAPQACWRR
jgi:hypothetical protein